MNVFCFRFDLFYCSLVDLYNAVFISAAQNTDLVIHIHTFFSMIIYPRILNTVSCAINLDILSYTHDDVFRPPHY